MKCVFTRLQFSRLTLAGLVLPAMLITTLPTQGDGAETLTDAEKKEVSVQMTTLFRAARAVISKNQSVINDATKGDKGLSGDAVIAAAKANYLKATGKELITGDASTASGRATTAMLQAVASVMDKAQPMINEQGKGFKGFLPAIFAKQVADEFTKNMQGAMAIKLTAPKAYVRNRRNRPDRWEHDILENYFKKADWDTGKPHFAHAKHKGKDAYRFILPEYYKASCLKCHGGPKGERDITGGKKEGGKLGELGGAISFAIFE